MRAQVSDEPLIEQLVGLRRKAAGHKSAVRRERRALQDTMESIRELEARCRHMGIGFEHVKGDTPCEI